MAKIIDGTFLMRGPHEMPEVLDAPAWSRDALDEVARGLRETIELIRHGETDPERISLAVDRVLPAVQRAVKEQPDKKKQRLLKALLRGLRAAKRSAGKKRLFLIIGAIYAFVVNYPDLREGAADLFGDVSTAIEFVQEFVDPKFDPENPDND